MSQGVLRNPFVQGLLVTLVAALFMSLLIAATVALSWPAVVEGSCSALLTFPLFVLLLPVIVGTGLFVQIRLAGRLAENVALFVRRMSVAGSLLSGLVLGCFGSFVVPQFLGYFAAFGADLPALTIAALAPGHFFWLVPVCVVTGGLVNLVVPLRTRWFGWAWIVGACLLVLVVGAMYLPIFKLGCVID